MKQLSVRIYDKNENVLKCYLLDMEEKMFILPKLESDSSIKKERKRNREVCRERKKEEEREREIF